MKNTSQSKPPILIARALSFFLQRRVHLEKDVIGRSCEYDDDVYKIFRKVILDPKAGHPKAPEAILQVRFDFARFGISVNKKLSLIPIPFIVGHPGFRSKTWMIGKETGKFQGLYEWDSVESARNYWDSFPMRLMKRRAVPESLHYEIHSVDE